MTIATIEHLVGSSVEKTETVECNSPNAVDEEILAVNTKVSGFDVAGGTQQAEGCVLTGMVSSVHKEVVFRADVRLHVLDHRETTPASRSGHYRVFRVVVRWRGRRLVESAPDFEPATLFSSTTSEGGAASNVPNLSRAFQRFHRPVRREVRAEDKHQDYLTESGS